MARIYPTVLSTQPLARFRRAKGFLFTIFCFFFFILSPLSIGQEIRDSLKVIEFFNASLEMFTNRLDSMPKTSSNNGMSSRLTTLMSAATAGTSILPQGWETCNFKGESLPDLLPGPFGTTLKPIHGQSYVGMVGRDNGTFESITQKLPEPLRVGVCYKLSVYLAKSSEYRSLSRLTGKEANYNRPMKLVILGVNGDNCQFMEENVVAVSPPIPNINWRKFVFIIRPTKQDITRLIFAAQFVIDKAYNGNILLDSFSQIVPVNCEDMSVSPLLGSGVARNLVTTINRALAVPPSQLSFVKKQPQLVGEMVDTEGGISTYKNTAYDAILKEIVTYPQLKLVIRVKGGKRLAKKRMAFLYSYIFRHTTLPARKVEIKRYKSEDELNFWGFESEDMAIGIWLMEN